MPKSKRSSAKFPLLMAWRALLWPIFSPLTLQNRSDSTFFAYSDEMTDKILCNIHSFF